MTQFVTETQAEAILAELRPGLRDQPPIDQFRERLDATVGTVCAIYHRRAVDWALAELRSPTQRAKTAMEGSAASPEMVNYAGLLKLDVVRPVLVALEELERALGRVPEAFSGEQKSAKGPAPRNWYSRFVRDLAEIANELGIEVTTQGDRERDPYATPFTRFVFAVERLLPSGAESKSLAACAKQIERAIKASAHEIDVERAFIAHARKIAENEYKALFARLVKRQRKPSKPAERSRDK
jgi:hypothetical protein